MTTKLTTIIQKCKYIKVQFYWLNLFGTKYVIQSAENNIAQQQCNFSFFQHSFVYDEHDEGENYLPY